MKNTEFLNFAVIYRPVKKFSRHRSTPSFIKIGFKLGSWEEWNGWTDRLKQENRKIYWPLVPIRTLNNFYIGNFKAFFYGLFKSRISFRGNRREEVCEEYEENDKHLWALLLKYCRGAIGYAKDDRIRFDHRTRRD